MKLTLFARLLALAVVGLYNQGHAMNFDLYHAIMGGDLRFLGTLLHAEPLTFDVNARMVADGYVVDEEDGKTYFVSKYNPDVRNRPDFYTEAKKTIQEYKPLSLACERDNLAIVYLLVENHNAQVNDRGGYSSVLKIAIDNCNPVMVHYLLSKGARAKQSWTHTRVPSLIQEETDAGNEDAADDFNTILALLSGRLTQPVRPVVPTQPIVPPVGAHVPEQQTKTFLTPTRVAVVGVACVLIALGIKKLYDKYGADGRVDADAEQELAVENA